jgi:EAL domain-containing protein (putative c-di-GMP-specific phosphodiesterase class I)
LELELAEGTLMRHAETAGRHVAALAALNIRIAIDDFGHDAFSLGFLQRLKVNTFKIDPTFVREIEFASSATPLLAALVGMAREMKLEVVAKGVETEPQAQVLRELGCDRAQGFFYSAPLLAVDVPTFLGEHSKT